MVRERQLVVVDVEVQTDEDDADLRVKKRGGVAPGDVLVVFGGDVATVGRVGAADEGDILGGEFLFDAGFADYEDFALVGGQGEDTGDVDGGAVGGGEDFFLFIFKGVRFVMG